MKIQDLAPLLQEKYLLPLINGITSQPKRKEYQCIKTETQKEITDIKNKRWEEKAKMIQGFADNYDMYNFFQATKAIYELGSNSQTPLPSSAGVLG